MRRPLLIPIVLAFVACSPAAPAPTPPTPTPVQPARTRRATPPPTPRRPVKVTFAGFFEAKTLRIDLEHRGNQRQESYQVRALVLEGPWAGSRKKRLDPYDYGAHRFEIRDAASGALLYSRGYSSLFGEWATTREAKKHTKSFSESVRIPLPKAAFELAIYTRQRSGKLARVMQTRLDPKSPRVKAWTRSPGVIAKDLHISGPLHRKLDILIIGDGYAKNNQAKFFADAKRFSRVLLENPTFGAHKDKLNLRALFAPSATSGVSEPRKGRVLNTPLGLSFNTFDSPRYLMTSQNLKLRQIAAHAPYDALYLMANTSRYGGGGIYNLYSTFPSDNEYDAYVFIHEFGHSFGGLGDEYYDSNVSYDDSEFYPKGVEPWEPNLTRFLKRQIKWKALLDQGVPIPTPNLAKYDGRVGLSEGAGYTAKGMYRPQLNCKMKGKGHSPSARSAPRPSGA